MSHHNRNWWRRWSWDAATSTATHDTGVSVRFSPDPDGSGAWNGKTLSLGALDGADPRRVARIMREAGDYAAHRLDRNPQ